MHVYFNKGLWAVQDMNKCSQIKFSLSYGMCIWYICCQETTLHLPALSRWSLEWNLYRTWQYCVVVFCQGLNFNGADLSRLDLRYINFKMANLRGTNLTHTNLSGANLERADLSMACLDVSCAEFVSPEKQAEFNTGLKIVQQQGPFYCNIMITLL